MKRYFIVTIIIILAVSSIVYICGLNYSYNWHYVHRQDIKNVLILGDSISIGYTPIVHELLNEKANINRPLVSEFSYIPSKEFLFDHGEPVNCKSTIYSLKELENWLDDKKWDVIHANWGLWDIDTIDVLVYEAQLELLIKKILPHTRVLIIATTTPIAKKENFKESNAKIKKIIEFNKVIVKLAKKYNLEVDDLYASALTKTGIYSTDNIHLNESGDELLANKVARTIEKHL
jgi:acyl-CoA thioesterase-1